MEGGVRVWSRPFLLFWLGQTVTQAGSALTRFSLGVWVFQRTGSASQFGLIVLFGSLPAVLVMPFTGALVDRMDRRRALILSDVGATLCTLALVALLFVGRLDTWHIWLIVAANSLCGSLGQPAHFALVTQLVARQEAARADGMLQISDALCGLAAPIVAGLLVSTVGLTGVVVIDLVTALFGLSTLARLRVPPRLFAGAEAPRQGLLREAAEGWVYLRQRTGLFGVLLVWAALSFIVELVTLGVSPLVLSFASPVALGSTLAAGGAGILTGALLMSAWGGPRRLVDGLLGAAFVGGLAISAIGLWRSVPWIAGGLFVSGLCLSWLSTCVQALWARCVAPGVRGRVYSVRAVIQGLCVPVCALLAGPLSEGVLQGLWLGGGPGGLGRLLGAGPGRGLSLLFVLGGVCAMAVAVTALLHPRVRAVELETGLPMTDGQSLGHGKGNP
ncbi:MFS transporter [Corallococcus sp. AS-1-12]|nr:MFS transporter [Corallococcus sp. AS-1-12]MBZ4329247.1 MFS transporter [Corallococcus sp. AS-1-12]